MKNALRSVFNLFFPPHCLACDESLQTGETILCTHCRHELPVTGLHYTTQKPIHQLLYGRVEIENASALLYFNKKGKVQQLIHNLKYRNHEEISSFLGKWLGAELASVKAYDEIDCIIPVPLHKSRLRKRGYNQVSGFAGELANKLNRPMYDTILYRRKNTKTQVFASRAMRAREVIHSFDIKEQESLKGQHILLVDDLITTGGTVEGCAIALSKVPGIKISLAFMAIA